MINVHCFKPLYLGISFMQFYDELVWAWLQAARVVWGAPMSLSSRELQDQFTSAACYSQGSDRTLGIWFKLRFELLLPKSLWPKQAPWSEKNTLLLVGRTAKLEMKGCELSVMSYQDNNLIHHIFSIQHIEYHLKNGIIPKMQTFFKQYIINFQRLLD